MIRSYLLRSPAVLLILVVSALTTAAAGSGAPQPGLDKVWVNGVVHPFQITGPGTAANQVTLYFIAAVDRLAPLHSAADAKAKGFGPHDHVIADPHPATPYAKTCDLTLTVPGPRAQPNVNVRLRMTLTPMGQRPLLYAANLGHGMLALTSVDRITKARKLGLAKLVDTKALLACTIEP
jgi:hypothetical protein